MVRIKYLRIGDYTIEMSMATPPEPFRDIDGGDEWETDAGGTGGRKQKLGGEIDLGHDLYIQTRIKEKRTGRVIPCGDSDDYAAKDGIGFFDICWWCGSPECDVRIKRMEICSSYGGNLTIETHMSFKDSNPQHLSEPVSR